MKVIILSLTVIGVFAEPPRFRPARFRSQRLELDPSTTDLPPEPTTDAAPYSAAGFKPAQPFTLPTETEAPADTYGAPQPTGPYPPSGFNPSKPFTLPNEQPPATSYGVPENTYGAPTTDASTDNPLAEKLDGPVELQKSVGTYYVLLPNGQLQRVEFVTVNDVQNMKYTARLQLQNPAPLFVIRP